METAIEKGITYVSMSEGELQLDSPTFLRDYSRELEDGREDIQAIYQEIQKFAKGYEDLLVELEDREGFSSLQERHRMIRESLDDYDSVTGDTCKVLDAHKEMATMVKTLEEAGIAETMIWSRKHELLNFNKGLNGIFDGIDFYIAGVHDILQEEIAYAKRLQQGEVAISSEEEQVTILASYQAVLGRCVQINRLLVTQLQQILPTMESLREDVMKAQVNLVSQDVEVRRQRLQALRQQTVIEDVTDYEDLEGQYRHTYDEEGNHIAIEEGGQGGHRKSLRALIFITLLVVIIFGIYVYMK